MATEKQRRANRLNARKSTGPRSPEGKARCAQNALKHGLRSQHLIVPGEDPAELQALLDALRLAFPPDDEVDEILIGHMAAAEWRMRRFNRSEAGLYWFRFNTARAPVKSDQPAPPATDEEISTYLHGRAMNDLRGEAGHLTHLARYEAATRRAVYQALQVYEARRRLRADQSPASESSRDAVTIEVARLPPASDYSTPADPSPLSLKLPNRPISETVPIESKG
jgi:hypothetical protein